MPELPEVETVKRSLAPFIEGKRIEFAEVFCKKIIKNMEPSVFQEKIAGRTIKEAARRGKYLLFRLDQGLTLVIHLRMTGQLTVCAPDIPLSKHTHVRFRLSSGQDWRFTDLRKFGLIYLTRTDCWAGIKGLQELGYEPLSPEFTLESLQELVADKKGILKAFLLDQRRIAGIGNIYADEISFAAGLHPQRDLSTLQEEEIARLYQAIRFKLAEGVRYRGTSLRDYVDGRGEKGGFQEKLQAYGRKGLPCLKCGIPLQRIVVAGRGTVFCPHCQH
jgi:formamidopyrimidine-DNA glycosylase